MLICHLQIAQSPAIFVSVKWFVISGLGIDSETHEFCDSNQFEWFRRGGISGSCGGTAGVRDSSTEISPARNELWRKISHLGPLPVIIGPTGRSKYRKP